LKKPSPYAKSIDFETEPPSGFPWSYVISGTFSPWRRS
jgi:hypothetical protein